MIVFIYIFVMILKLFSALELQIIGVSDLVGLG